MDVRPGATVTISASRDGFWWNPGIQPAPPCAPCNRRTLAQAAGALAAELGLTLDGPVKENCSRIRDLLSTRRCLVVLDALSSEIAADLTAGGRTSTAIARDEVKILETPWTPAYARRLIKARLYAEAYELFLLRCWTP
jgi:hypothetical protein